MLRRSVAATLVVAAGALPLVAVVLGWRWFLDGPLGLLLAAGAGYAGGAWLPRRSAVVGVLLAVAGMVTANQLDQAGYHWLDDLVFFLVLVAGPAVAGAAVTTRAAQVARLDELRARLDAQQRADVAAARLETRTRVHQELHTRLAERIAGIAVRAQGAHRSADAVALVEIESEAREVLDQLRAALGSLGEDEPVARPSGPTGHDVPPAGPPRVSVSDVAVAAALGAALAVESVVVPASRGPAWANVVTALVVAAPLVTRRAHPVAAVAATTAAGTLMSVSLTPVTMTVTGVALLTVVFYTVGSSCRGRWWILGWVVAAAGTVAMGAVSSWVDPQPGEAPWMLLLWAIAATLLGRITGGWHERLRRAEAMVTALERGRGAAVRLARAREGQALASELHDTVAHAMTVVCLQAGAHRRPGGDPAAALGTIAASAAASLAELRDGLDAIETGDHPLDAARIVAIGRRVGVDVDVLAGPSPVLAGPSGTLALRVLREALVNVARHAPGASAQVSLAGGPGTVDVEVRDAGGVTGTGSVLAGSGTGLAGLAQAVRSAGGTLEWGPCRSGGFRVAAHIPEVCR